MKFFTAALSYLIAEECSAESTRLRTKNVYKSSPAGSLRSLQPDAEIFPAIPAIPEPVSDPMAFDSSDSMSVEFPELIAIDPTEVPVETLYISLSLPSTSSTEYATTTSTFTSDPTIDADELMSMSVPEVPVPATEFTATSSTFTSATTTSASTSEPSVDVDVLSLSMPEPVVLPATISASDVASTTPATFEIELSMPVPELVTTSPPEIIYTNEFGSTVGATTPSTTTGQPMATTTQQSLITTTEPSTVFGIDLSLSMSIPEVEIFPTESSTETSSTAEPSAGTSTPTELASEEEWFTEVDEEEDSGEYKPPIDEASIDEGNSANMVGKSSFAFTIAAIIAGVYMF